MKLLMVLASLSLSTIAWGSIDRAPVVGYEDAVTVVADTVQVTRAAHDHIVGDGIFAILDQAASTPVVDGETGRQIGYELTDIDRGSVFQTVGLQDGDVVLEIEGVALVTPQIAVDMLRIAKNLDRFDVLLMRLGNLKTLHVVVTQ